MTHIRMGLDSSPRQGMAGSSSTRRMSRIMTFFLLFTIIPDAVSAMPFSGPLLSTPRLQYPTVQDHSPLAQRNSNPSLESLKIPTCGLTCYINTLTTDHCESETDFECHCSKGDILGKAKACLEKGCNDEDQKDAESKIRAACAAVGVNLGDGDGDGNSDGQSSMSGGTRTTTGGSSTTTVSSTSSSASSSSPTPTNTSGNPNTNPSGAPAPGPDPTNSSPSSPPNEPTQSSSPPMPTDTPLALNPMSRPLSTAAKAGISVSVSVFTTAILVTIILYIRRLKRDLALAQAAASVGVPESVWRASVAPTSPVISRRKSWGGRSRGRRDRRSWGDGSPVSPLSPREFEIGGGGGGSKSKKRGHVLSVVVEREDEDSSSMDRIVHEPVPGQKEGLAGPLELDGEYTGIVELPTSITPRARSMERNRERGASLGESSRPSTSTSGLEKIDERSGL